MMSILAILVGAAVLCVPSFYGLVLFFASLIFLPGSLAMELGGLNLPVHRIAVLMLFINLLVTRKDLRTFQWHRADTCLLVFFAGQIAAGVFTTDLFVLLENRSGMFMDVAMPYFAVRIILNSKERYLLFLRYTLMLSALLVFPALYQMTRGVNLLDLGRHKPQMFRNNFYRAYVSFDNSIYFGMYYAAIATAGAGLILQDRGPRRIGSALLTAAACVGVMTSMSSGPLMALIISAAVIALYPLRRRWKMILLTVALGCLAVEVISNRHFYEVVDRFTFQSQTAWYRSRLIEIALFEGGMKDHWMVGYGFADPGWGGRIVGPGYVSDIVNQYLFYLCRFGLLGLVPFFLFLWFTLRRLFGGFLRIQPSRDQWLVWCLGGAIIGMLISLNTVSVFGAVLSVFYMLLAMANNISQQVSMPRRRVVKRIIKVQKKTGGTS